MNGLVFASYRFFMKFQLDNPESVPTLTQIALAGAGSGIVSSYAIEILLWRLSFCFSHSFQFSIITTPVELVKIQQQSQLTRTTARSVAWQIYNRHGLQGLYRGITVTALRDCGYGAYFFAASVLSLLARNLRSLRFY